MLDKTDPAETGPCVGDHPNFFAGTALLLDEVTMGINTLNKKVADLRAFHKAETASSLKRTADEAEKLAGQLETLFGVLAKVSTSYINRKPRHE